MIKGLWQNFNLLGCLGFADLITLLNLASGVLSIFFSVKGIHSYAAALLFFAVVFDFMDGKVARFLDKSSELGMQLDSLSDLISFGVAPAAICFSLQQNPVVGGICILFVVAGALRLARYNVSKKKYFEGLPITINGIVVPLLFFVGASRFIYIYFIVMSLFMISSFRLNRVV